MSTGLHDYNFTSDFAHKYLAEGEAKGEVKGRWRSIRPASCWTEGTVQYPSDDRHAVAHTTSPLDRNYACGLCP